MVNPVTNGGFCATKQNYKNGPTGSWPTAEVYRKLLDQGLITCTLLYKSRVKLEAMAMEKELQVEDEALDKDLKEITCLHLVAGAGAPPSDEYINGLGGEVVLTEYHPGFFKLYPKLVLTMTSSKKEATIASKLAYAQIKGSRAVIKMGKR